MAASCLVAVRTALTAPTVCHLLRRHVSSSAGLWSSEQTRRAAGGPEYIPRGKGKSPMMKIGYAWMIGLPAGIMSFFLVKRQVDKNRLKQLKIRQRMRQSNEGDYDGSRYRQRVQSVKPD
ncbi:DUF4748 domain-containing protein [Nematolebias whitei]|uniref:DUF4748 domain-containing protein n=1 Tax=Nematolebias whitei TaxID=451745 RepID=UPI00189C1660|nr:DUF4748 domain-containing protein [Nematolebias whitei]